MEQSDKELIERVITNKSYIRLMEPCNCGGMVLHNNGGNYHKLLAVMNENDIWYSRNYSTCELIEKPEWEKETETTVRQLLNDAFEDGFYLM